MSTLPEKANLARIRDNQRRSRARRKEYLQELEARLRQCELQGVEASAEIQTAARKVAEENKKLRSLLAQQGVQDDRVKAYIQSTPANDMTMGGPYGSNSGAVQVLEQLLQTHKSCCTDGAGPIDAGRWSSDGDSSGSVTTTSNVWDSTYPKNASGRWRSRAIQQARTVSPMQQFIITPRTSPAKRTSTMSLGPNSGFPYQQRLSSGQMARNTTLEPNQHIYEEYQNLSLPNQSCYSLHGQHTEAATFPELPITISDIYANDIGPECEQLQLYSRHDYDNGKSR